MQVRAFERYILLNQLKKNLDLPVDCVGHP